MPSRNPDADPRDASRPDTEEDPDKSMETILASIRRIISEEDAPRPSEPPGNDDDLVLLDESMMVHAEPPPSPPRAEDSILAPETLVAASRALNALHDVVHPPVVETPSGSLPLFRSGGPTLEDIVRDELRGQLKSWLDVHLPGIVERLVRIEIERLHRRA